MLIGVPRELLDNESRGGNKNGTTNLKLGFEGVEHHAGFEASFEDQHLQKQAPKWLSAGILAVRYHFK